MTNVNGVHSMSKTEISESNWKELNDEVKRLRVLNAALGDRIVARDEAIKELCCTGIIVVGTLNRMAALAKEDSLALLAFEKAITAGRKLA